jgi:hypothetical protein
LNPDKVRERAGVALPQLLKVLQEQKS